MIWSGETVNFQINVSSVVHVILFLRVNLQGIHCSEYQYIGCVDLKIMEDPFTSYKILNGFYIGVSSREVIL
jgi:hypothetical protein